MPSASPASSTRSSSSSRWSSIASGQLGNVTVTRDGSASCAAAGPAEAERRDRAEAWLRTQRERVESCWAWFREA